MDLGSVEMVLWRGRVWVGDCLEASLVSSRLRLRNIPSMNELLLLRDRIMWGSLGGLLPLSRVGFGGLSLASSAESNELSPASSAESNGSSLVSSGRLSPVLLVVCSLDAYSELPSSEERDGLLVEEDAEGGNPIGINTWIVGFPPLVGDRKSGQATRCKRAQIGPNKVKLLYLSYTASWPVQVGKYDREIPHPPRKRHQTLIFRLSLASCCPHGR